MSGRSDGARVFPGRETVGPRHPDPPVPISEVLHRLVNPSSFTRPDRENFSQFRDRSFIR